eukprot:tig00000863_g5010.t1
MRQQSRGGRGTTSQVVTVEPPKPIQVRRAPLTERPAEWVPPQRPAVPWSEDFVPFQGKGLRLDEIGGEDGTLCDKCGRKVPAASLALHELRCRPESSRGAAGGGVAVRGAGTVTEEEVMAAVRALPEETVLAALNLGPRPASPPKRKPQEETHRPDLYVLDESLTRKAKGKGKAAAKNKENEHPALAFAAAPSIPAMTLPPVPAAPSAWRHAAAASGPSEGRKSGVNENGEPWEESWTTDADGTRRGEKWGRDGNGEWSEKWSEKPLEGGGIAGELVGSNSSGDQWGEKWGATPDGASYGEKSFTSGRTGERTVDQWADNGAGEKWGEKMIAEPGGNVTTWEKWFERVDEAGGRETYVEKWGENKAEAKKWGRKDGVKANGDRYGEEWGDEEPQPGQEHGNVWRVTYVGNAAGWEEVEKTGRNPAGEVWHDRYGTNEDGEKWAEKSGTNEHGDEWFEHWEERRDVKWAEKTGKNARGDVWEEKWWENRHEDGTVKKGARKKGKNGDGEEWEENWGELYRADFSSIEKWTSKWADDGKGSRWGRNWGGRDLGGGRFHKWGDIWHNDFVDEKWDYETDVPIY